MRIAIIQENIKGLLAILTLCVAGTNGFSQYYYKDLVSTNQINQTFSAYRKNKVSNVKLNSFQGEVAVSEGFVCEQKVNLSKNQVITYTKTADRGESYFTAFYNPQGLLSKTIDSTEETISTSVYTYDANSRLSQLSHETRATDNSSRTSETHTWVYTPDGKPQRMLRVKNAVDSSTFTFLADEKGNIIEEAGVRKGSPLEKVYYYYDSKNRLTDVVRYNVKARRLLPDYIFEYEDNGELSTMTIVPEGSNEYQKWYYKYDDTGLKQIEFCYNKRNQLLGKVEYVYTEGR